MARVKISEYKAKSLILGDSYEGVQLRSGEKVPEGRWVAKVDQGIKKRFKQGLVSIDKPVSEITSAIKSWEGKGFSQFLLEPYFEHEASEEQYLSLERVRAGVRMLHAAGGGVDIEEHPEKVATYLIGSEQDMAGIAAKSGLPGNFLTLLYKAFNVDQFGFVEINPLVVRGDETHLLDAAVLVDDAAEFFVRGAWTGDDIIRPRAKHVSEDKVAALDATTPSSLKLSVINPDGALFFLLSGGGGSIVIADEAQIEGAGDMIANYGEYSGGPSREETYLYAKEVIALMLDSKAPKKALVIAGGVANFTDVKKTFAGIIDALTEKGTELQGQGVKVFVRRGGPNESAGLALMRDFLERGGLFGSIYGSESPITKAVEDAIHFIRV